MEKIAAFRAEAPLGELCREQRDGDGGGATRRPFRAIGSSIGQGGEAQRRPPECMRQSPSTCSAPMPAATTGAPAQRGDAANTSSHCGAHLGHLPVGNIACGAARQSSSEASCGIAAEAAGEARDALLHRRAAAVERGVLIDTVGQRRRGCGARRPCWRSRRRRGAARQPLNVARWATTLTSVRVSPV